MHRYAMHMDTGVLQPPVSKGEIKEGIYMNTCMIIKEGIYMSMIKQTPIQENTKQY